MLLSVLIAVTPTKSTHLVGTTGLALQSWFLGQIAKYDEALSESFHAVSFDRPYTVSSLIDDYGIPLTVGSMVHNEKNYWLRITTYHSRLSDIFYNCILKNLPSSLRLHPHSLNINGWTTDVHQHPLAKIMDYQELSKKAARGEKQIRLQFLSPTAFKSNGKEILLPLSRRVFTSYFRKWNFYAPESLHLDKLWLSFVEDCVVNNELVDLNTSIWDTTSDRRRRYKGFTGTVGFALMPKKKCGNMQPYWDGAEEVLRSLAIFSTFCGTGHHTTIGMGQTKCL